MDAKESTAWTYLQSQSKPRRVRAWFDGGVRDGELSACGWLLQASWANAADLSDFSDWTTVAWGSLLLDSGTTVTDAELTGCEQATSALLCFAQQGFVDFNGELRVEKPEDA
eukprot:1447249-Karenia_brevis.AAC.1